MDNPALAWNLICAALLTWGFGAVVMLHTCATRSCRGSALWLLGPVLWPLALPVLAWCEWRERREASEYHQRRIAVAPPEIIQLVPKGTPYGSPITGGGLLAPHVKPHS